MAKGRLGAKAACNGGAIKNKIKRQQIYHRLKKEGGAAQRKARAARQKEAEKLGDAAPKPVQRTLDNTRETDETTVEPGKSPHATPRFPPRVRRPFPPHVGFFAFIEALTLFFRV